MSDTEFADNNMANRNDDLHSTKPHAEEFTNFANTEIDQNNCLYKALTKKLKPCKHFEPGQKLPVAQTKKNYASCQH